MRSPDDALHALCDLPGAAGVLAAVAAVEDAWVVGGAVRDALLGGVPRELDVVVAGDPAPLLARLGGDVRAHERFGVATITLPGGRVDIVRARAEGYPAPGTLPEVRPGTLEEDLARRDVTVNAIALRPEGGARDGRDDAAGRGGTEGDGDRDGGGGAGSGGTEQGGDRDGAGGGAGSGGTERGGDRDAPSRAVLRAVPGALDDLAAGVLRVLHDASFADDPTRLWRVARYAARLGFAVEPHTAALAAAADPGTVSGVRLGNELRLALREPDPLAAFAAARALNATLLPAGFDVAPRGLAAALALLPAPEGRPDLVVLAACCAGVDAATLVRRLDDLGFTAAERAIVAAGSRAAVLAPLRRARTPSEIARAARGAPVEVVALAGGDAAARWLRELRHVHLQITGDDLMAAGVPEGPEVGRRLAQALDRKLDDGLAGRDAELAAALSDPAPPS